MTGLFFAFKFTDANGLATKSAEASRALVLAQLFYNTPVSGLEGLMQYTSNPSSLYDRVMTVGMLKTASDREIAA